MRLEGATDDCDDVWVYFLSDNVHQLGFGKKHHLRLNVPSGELRHQVFVKNSAAREVVFNSYTTFLVVIVTLFHSLVYLYLINS